MKITTEIVDFLMPCQTEGQQLNQWQQVLSSNYRDRIELYHSSWDKMKWTVPKEKEGETSVLAQ